MPNETLHPPSTRMCGWCGQSAPEQSFTYSVEDERVCQSCAEDAQTCERCRDITCGPLRAVRGGRLVCTVCASGFTECTFCEVLTSSPVSTDGDGMVCSGCASAHYWTCDSYGCTTRIDSGEYCTLHEDEDEPSRCSCGCQNDDDGDDEDTGRLINNYSFKPRPKFHGEGPLFLGFELEINTPWGETGSCAQAAVNAVGELAYLKEDSSISRGFELVTHPMSHTHARESFPWHLLRDLQSRGCDGYDTGLHVHVSRDGFSGPTHVYRWLKFLHRNQEHVTRIARRESDEWAAWDEDDRYRAKDFAKGDRYGGRGRYSAINVQNSATFEVRVFASSLVPQEVQAALDLVAASVEYCRHLTVADIHARGGWTWAAFITWAATRPEYAALTRETGSDIACAC